MKKYISIVKHYEKCLEKHGDNHLGVDWPNLKDVEIRYEVMIDVIQTKNEQISLLDFGCGLSHFYEYILKNNINYIKYSGLDISKKFIQSSKSKFPLNTYYCVDVLENSDRLPSFDYIIMNGVFTEKQDLSFEEMFRYFKNVMKVIFFKAKRGLSFNVMSNHVDWERNDLFHLSHDILIDFVVKELTRNYIIRNDYGLYEYTVYLYRKRGRP